MSFGNKMVRNCDLTFSENYGLTIDQIKLKLKKVIYFDGVCYLCHWAVKSLIHMDKKGIFYFAAIQSEYAQKFLLHVNGQYIKLNTVIYHKEDQIFTMSDAVLEILYDLGGFWRVFLITKVIPVSLRDKLYQFVATHRYGWFGRKDRCMLPSEVASWRFLN